VLECAQSLKLKSIIQLEFFSENKLLFSTNLNFFIQTNTYQMVLATDEMMTFAMFNYEYISWITHLDNYAGLNGPPAFVSYKLAIV